MTTIEEILAARSDTLAKEEETLIRSAYDFAKAAHEGHTRYSGEPYFIHPAAVAKTLAQYGMDAPTIAAGLLHDAIEDGRTTAEAVKEAFGPEVLFLVEGVTKLGTHRYRGAERHAESLRRLLVATAADIRVLIIKLADRYHNMQTLAHVPEAKRRRIALETIEIYAPIADRLEMGVMKKELEDLAFPYVDPDSYRHTLELRQSKTKETEAGLAKVRKTLRKELAKKGIADFRTDIRIKGLWSLYQKLARKKDDLSQIHDIAALRIIVPEADDCYSTLGVIHALYKPLPGRFKDYIAFPKPNGYQSLHTTILTPEAGIVEAQIRTRAMHQAAEYGIASHMAYKEFGEAAKGRFAAFSFSWARSLLPSLLRMRTKTPDASRAGSTPSKSVPSWLAELADAHAAVAGSEEFVEGLKEDFFSVRVFVFTPKGDVVDLPLGATPIDFAYAIHSDLGNHSAGAKVNGKLVTFDTELGNGDVVEIVRRESARPREKWLEVAKTALARRRIRLALGMTEPDKPVRPRTVRARRHAKKA
jgi:GTP pyrophosphokinase